MSDATSAAMAPDLAIRLIENAPDAAIVIDSAGIIRYMNRAFVRLSGHGHELCGATMNRILPDAIASRHDGFLLHHLQSRKPSKVLGKVREMELQHRNGYIVPVELKAFELVRPHGEVYFGAFMTDIRKRRRIERRNERLLKTLKQQALFDPLTGLANRRAFEAEARRIIARAGRHASVVQVGIADLDGFKGINDTYGHAAGDAVLREVSHAIQGALRAGDLVGRIGGEEFGLILADTPNVESGVIAERIRTAVAKTRSTENAIKVTISIGLARLGLHESLTPALARADTALLAAKASGKNRVCAA